MELSQVLEELSNKKPVWYYGSHANVHRRTYLFMTGDKTVEQMFGKEVKCPYAVAFDCYRN